MIFGKQLTNINKHLRYWVDALPASVGVGQWCTAPFLRSPLPSRPPPRRPPTPPWCPASYASDLTLSPLPHLLETRQTIQSCFTDKYEGGDRFVTFEDSCVTFIGGVCPTLKCETGGGGGELSEHLLRGVSEKKGRFIHILLSSVVILT